MDSTAKLVAINRILADDRFHFPMATTPPSNRKRVWRPLALALVAQAAGFVVTAWCLGRELRPADTLYEFFRHFRADTLLKESVLALRNLAPPAVALADLGVSHAWVYVAVIFLISMWYKQAPTPTPPAAVTPRSMQPPVTATVKLSGFSWNTVPKSISAPTSTTPRR